MGRTQENLVYGAVLKLLHFRQTGWSPLWSLTPKTFRKDESSMFHKKSPLTAIIISLLFQWVKIWNRLRSVSLADGREMNAALAALQTDINKGPNTDQLINKGPNTDQTINKGPNSKLIYDAWASIFQDIMIQDFIFKSDFKVCSNHREQIIHIRLLHCELEKGSDHHQCSQDCLHACRW